MIRPGLPALSLWNPHAGLMAIGAKAVESRGRKLGLRPGPLAIASTLSVAAEYRGPVVELWRNPVFRRHLDPEGWTTLDAMPRGCILALVWVLAEVSATELIRHAIRDQYGADELHFGFYNAPGRVAITTDRARLIRLPRPVPAKGKQGVWRVDRSARDAIRAQLERDPKFQYYRDTFDTAD